MNLLILRDSDRLSGNLFRIEDDRARHIREVLRLAPGDPLEAGILNGPLGKGTVEEIHERAVTLRCEFESEPRPDSLAIDLICALPRQQTLKKVLWTSGTMGIRTLHLIRAYRVEKSYFNTHLLRAENYEPFLIEGLSQGKRTLLPRVVVHPLFKPFFEDTLPALEAEEPLPALKLLPDPDAGEMLDAALDRSEGIRERVAIAIGPEGGWIPFELETMKRAGFVPFRLGPWILRVETAVAAAVAQVELVSRSRTKKR